MSEKLVNKFVHGKIKKPVTIDTENIIAFTNYGEFTQILYKHSAACTVWMCIDLPYSLALETLDNDKFEKRLLDVLP